MTDPFPHVGHDVTEWEKDPVAGYLKNIGYCWDCGEFFEYEAASAKRRPGRADS